jgi:hypothetical protein
MRLFVNVVNAVNAGKASKTENLFGRNPGGSTVKRLDSGLTTFTTFTIFTETVTATETNQSSTVRKSAGNTISNSSKSSL